MPIIKSAKKRMRQNEKLRLKNRAIRTFIKNLKRKTISIIQDESSSGEQIAVALNNYKKHVDRAWAKGIIKRNKSSHLKSKMDIMLNKKMAVNK